MPMIERARLRMAKRANHVKWLLAGIMALGALAPSVTSLPQLKYFEGITCGCKRLDTTGEGERLGPAIEGATGGDAS
jgi:hypothetical protein